MIYLRGSGNGSLDLVEGLGDLVKETFPVLNRLLLIPLLTITRLETNMALKPLKNGVWNPSLLG